MRASLTWTRLSLRPWWYSFSVLNHKSSNNTYCLVIFMLFAAPSHWLIITLNLLRSILSLSSGPRSTSLISNSWLLTIKLCKLPDISITRLPLAWKGLYMAKGSKKSLSILPCITAGPCRIRPAENKLRDGDEFEYVERRWSYFPSVRQFWTRADHIGPSLLCLF